MSLPTINMGAAVKPTVDGYYTHSANGRLGKVVNETPRSYKVEFEDGEVLPRADWFSKATLEACIEEEPSPVMAAPPVLAAPPPVMAAMEPIATAPPVMAAPPPVMAAPPAAPTPAEEPSPSTASNRTSNIQPDAPGSHQESDVLPAALGLATSNPHGNRTSAENRASIVTKVKAVSEEKAAPLRSAAHSEVVQQAGGTRASTNTTKTVRKTARNTEFVKQEGGRSVYTSDTSFVMIGLGKDKMNRQKDVEMAICNAIQTFYAETYEAQEVEVMLDDDPEGVWVDVKSVTMKSVKELLAQDLLAVLKATPGFENVCSGSVSDVGLEGEFVVTEAAAA